jgi:hypothetical protein
LLLKDGLAKGLLNAGVFSAVSASSVVFFTAGFINALGLTFYFVSSSKTAAFFYKTGAFFVKVLLATAGEGSTTSTFPLTFETIF